MRPLDSCAPPDLRYLRQLTDDFGVIQHTERGEPRHEFGYAIDDVARALVIVVEARSVFPALSADAFHRLADVYLRFIEHCRLPDGRFHNFIGIDRNFYDDTGSLDSFGRTLWALGVTAASDTADDMGDVRRRARTLFLGSVPRALGVPYIRAKAFMILGLAPLVEKNDALNVLETLRHVTADLLHVYADAATNEWPWFEDTLRYSNAGVVYGLLAAAATQGLQTADPQLAQEARAAGLRALDFLLDVLPVDGLPAPVGNRGWFPKGGPRAVYDQQCVDVAAMVVACAQAWRLTHDARYRQAADVWWSWFFGNNTQHRSLYRPEDGAVYDGLMPTGVSEDRGAESVITFLLAHLKMAEVFCHPASAQV